MIISVVLPNAGASQSFDFTPYSHGARGPNVITATNGVFAIDATQVNLAQLLAAGFLLAPTVCTTANRPNSAYPGQEVFDSTLGTPIWRNAANTGWVNSAGSAV